MGEAGHQAQVVKDDFQAEWKELDTVTDDLSCRTYYGNINYLQTLERSHPLIMHPGKQYRLALSFDPAIAFADE
ncbi:MAG: hypothetical protein ACJAYS_001047 [Lentimonas sp.]